MGRQNERDGLDPDEAQERRERRRRLIERLNENDTHVQSAKRRSEMSEEELERELERQWNFSRRGFGQIFF